MRVTLPALRAWEPEDLVQEVYARALTRLDQFGGRASFKTWVVTMGRNLLLDMATSASIRPVLLEDVTSTPGVGVSNLDPTMGGRLRRETRALRKWLKTKEGRKFVPYGAAVLRELLRSGANFSYTALALTLRTGKPWTVEGVRTVVRKIRTSHLGQELCDSLGYAEVTPF